MPGGVGDDCQRRTERIRPKIPRRMDLCALCGSFDGRPLAG